MNPKLIAMSVLTVLLATVGCVSRRSFVPVASGAVQKWRPGDVKWKGGDGSELREYLEEFALNRDETHLVFSEGSGAQRKLLELDDTEQYAVWGDTLYVYWDHKYCHEGWWKLTKPKEQPRLSWLTGDVLGEIQLIGEQATPSERPQGEGVFRFELGHVKKVADLRSVDSLFDLSPGQYYVSQPGLGVRYSISLRDLHGSARP